MQFKSFRHNYGFTLIELITVIVILGILATVGASKFFSNAAFNDTRYHQEIISAFRYAQKIAIASQNNITIRLSSNSYYLFYSSFTPPDNCSDNRTEVMHVKHPAGQGNYCEDNISSTINPAASYTYNASGEASSCGVFSVGSHKIKVEKITGYVHECKELQACSCQ